MDAINELDMDSALQFLMNNRRNPPRKVDKQKLKASLDVFTKLAQNGLSSEIIQTLAFEVIFQDHYDIPVRRKLLYACIPASSYFPYEVIPLAISSATLPGVSSTWQLSILTWISALLQFHIIDESNRFVHVCYPALFNMLSYLKTCELVCKILCQITRREDITPLRVQILLRLEKRHGFRQCIPHLLRIYKIFRPDLVAYRLDQLKRLPAVPKWFQTLLATARARLEEKERTVNGDHSLWPELGIKRKANPFHEPSALPQPEILVYTEKIEEQKKRMISVLQFRRIAHMIKHMSLWKEWRWPNNASSLLWKPTVIALFRPHDAHVKVAVTNWLELALRTEVIEQLGNPSKQRRESLLEACIKLVKQTETLVPAVYHFLVEFFVKWDKYSHMPQVLELLSYMPFVSPTCFFEIVLQGFSQIMSVASVSLFCTILDAFSKTCMTWALQSEKERSASKEPLGWPFVTDEVCPLEGIHFLTQRLERVIMAALLRFGPHPLLLSTALNYYTKVNMSCEELCLSLLVVPPPEFVFVVLTSANVVATHQLGILLSRMRTRVEEIRKCKVSGDEKLMRSVTLLSVDSINFSVMVYLDTIVKSKSFNDHWMETLSPFLGESFQKNLRSVQGITCHGSILRALPYLPLTLNHILQLDDPFANKDEMAAATEKTVSDLTNLQLGGIRNCADTYIQIVKKKS